MNRLNKEDISCSIEIMDCERVYDITGIKDKFIYKTYFRDDDECRFFYGLPLATWNDFFVIPVKPDYMNREYGIEVSEDDNPYLLFVKFY